MMLSMIEPGFVVAKALPAYLARNGATMQSIVAGDIFTKLVL